ncbi:MAG TPA: DUF4331 domain-containing protein [Burkholderiaceae bacterium]|nr:DUF4331 domain-containing protein [Burkholderiaceae bacterium]
MIAKSVLRARLLPVAAAVLGAVAGAVVVPSAYASSHREAPGITLRPKVDGTDFYMFSSYDPARTGYVTLIANYQPLQAPYGGPNYFLMDSDALYEIHIDNDGDNREDITFQFKFNNNRKNVELDIAGQKVAIPLVQAGQVADRNAAALNVNESFTVDVVRGLRRQKTNDGTKLRNVSGGGATFDKPVDNIGTKTIPDYKAYADKHIHQVNIPGCNQPGQLFVGQRKEPFAVNLGTIFDLVNAPVSVIADRANAGAVANTIDDANITTLALEVHKSCLTKGNDPVIGGWTTASIRQGRLSFDKPFPGFKFPHDIGGAWTQVSRLGMPLVNELGIGLPDKDLFNGSQPKDDAKNFLKYVTNPTLPRLLEIALDKDPAFGGTATGKIAPKNFPRTDLMNVFLTGIAGVNRPANANVGSEMLRLNTNTPATAEAAQNTLGLAGGDPAGFPNGRRPKDDVVDISLVAFAGGLCVINGDNDGLKLNSSLGAASACKPSSVPLGNTSLQLHDGVDQSKIPLLPTFPYLFTPTPGAGPGSN